MTSAARSVFYFGIYLYVVGLTLMALPNVFLSTLQLPETNEVWIRVVGVLVFCLGYYYYSTGKQNNTAFFALTVTTRFFVFVSFIIFVVLDYVSPLLIGIGAIDLIGALWTMRTLNQKE